MLRNDSLTIFRLFDALRQRNSTSNSTSNAPNKDDVQLFKQKSGPATKVTTDREECAKSTVGSTANGSIGEENPRGTRKRNLVSITYVEGAPRSNRDCVVPPKKEVPVIQIIDDVEKSRQDNRTPEGQRHKKSRKRLSEKFKDKSVGELLSTAESLLHGKNGFKEDESKATRMAKEALMRCNNEDLGVDALFELASYYHKGHFEKEDLQNAAKLYECVLRVKWNPMAARNLARISMDGVDGELKRDFLQAKILFNQILDRDSPDEVVAPVMNDLGELHFYGAEGVKQDTEAALRLWEKASTVRYPCVQAMTNLANIKCVGVGSVKKDIPHAVALYETAIQKELVGEAMCQLAKILQRGAPGVEKDVVRAKELHEWAIKEGFTPSLIELGMLLTTGDGGVDRDCNRACELFERAMQRESYFKEFITCGFILCDFIV